jgi:toxin ParE1/3/4
MTKKYSIFWTSSAKKDLNEIIDYISIDSKKIALEKLIQIEKVTNKIINFPKKGRIIPELEKRNITMYREIIIKPWRIFYKIEENRIPIIAVIDGRRNIEEILLRRQLR